MGRTPFDPSAPRSTSPEARTGAGRAACHRPPSVAAVRHQGWPRPAHRSRGIAGVDDLCRWPGQAGRKHTRLSPTAADERTISRTNTRERNANRWSGFDLYPQATHRIAHKTGHFVDIRNPTKTNSLPAVKQGIPFRAVAIQMVLQQLWSISAVLPAAFPSTAPGAGRGDRRRACGR
jgi:hypothetical protein